MTNKNKFKWNVWNWDINHDTLEVYDVVPKFMEELKKISRSKKPKTKEEFEEFLESEARYHFWSKCEYEMIIHAWPAHKNEVKVDIYEQLKLNWEVFVESFWNYINKKKI